MPEGVAVSRGVLDVEAFGPWFRELESAAPER
jgi:hypothetical protein